MATRLDFNNEKIQLCSDEVLEKAVLVAGSNGYSWGEGNGYGDGEGDGYGECDGKGIGMGYGKGWCDVTGYSWGEGYGWANE